MLTSIVGVIILLGGLIFFHEFGHYSIAKLFGVKVEVFSLGFGKKIFRRVVGETEYALSLFPLGGYVKLMGDDPYKGVPAAEAHRAFSTQKLYKRFLIVAAGPLANLILAYVLFMVVFWSGKPMESTRVGTVNIGSPAWEAGIRPRDRILEIAGHKTETWDEMKKFLRLREGEKLEVVVDRAGTELKIPVPITRVRGKSDFGEDEEVGGIKGINPYPLASLVGVSNPESLAYRAGLRTGDLITKIDSTNILRFDELNETVAAALAKGGSLSVTVKRSSITDPKDTGTEQTYSLPLPKHASAATSVHGATESLGIFPSELFVKRVTPNSPAEKGGLMPGDRVVKVADVPVHHFDLIVDVVQERGTKSEPVAFTLEREGKPVVLNLRPVETTYEDPLTRQPVKKFMVGFEPMTAYRESELTRLKIRNPIALLTQAAVETYDLADKMVVSIAKLAIGKISVKNLGGPVLIASVAGKSLDAGLIPFLQMMALISINLFLLNLFPVPILDGGHLLFFMIEGIKGKPVSVRTMEIANQIGMVFILMLVGLTLFNDISRIVLH